jgi:hypothetical protein
MPAGSATLCHARVAGAAGDTTAASAPCTGSSAAVCLIARVRASVQRRLRSGRRAGAGEQQPARMFLPRYSNCVLIDKPRGYAGGFCGELRPVSAVAERAGAASGCQRLPAAARGKVVSNACDHADPAHARRRNCVPDFLRQAVCGSAHSAHTREAGRCLKPRRGAPRWRRSGGASAGPCRPARRCASSARSARCARRSCCALRGAATSSGSRRECLQVAVRARPPGREGGAWLLLLARLCMWMPARCFAAELLLGAR